MIVSPSGRDSAENFSLRDPGFSGVLVAARSARYRGLPRAWLGLIWVFVIRSEGLARQLA